MSAINFLKMLWSQFDYSNLDNVKINPKSLTWYKSLDIDRKINLKELAPLIIGVEWSVSCNLLGQKEIISIIFDKLNEFTDLV